jgi:thiamine phosphate synthase YjbQ (UPF0047 family)
MGGMRSELITIRTGSRALVHDLTRECEGFVRSDGDGLLNVFVPHATAGVALPTDDRWQHRHGSPGHGRDHVVPAFIAPSVSVPVLGGRLQLGTWQSICLVDTNVDNSERAVRLSLLAG